MCINSWLVLHSFIFLCRSCISGRQHSLKPGGSDEWSYKYRATDILVSVCGPLQVTLMQEVVAMCRPLEYEVHIAIISIIDPLKRHTAC